MLDYRMSLPVMTSAQFQQEVPPYCCPMTYWTADEACRRQTVHYLLYGCSESVAGLAYLCVCERLEVERQDGVVVYGYPFAVNS